MIDSFHFSDSTSEQKEVEGLSEDAKTIKKAHKHPGSLTQEDEKDLTQGYEVRKQFKRVTFIKIKITPQGFNLCSSELILAFFVKVCLPVYCLKLEFFNQNLLSKELNQSFLR